VGEGSVLFRKEKMKVEGSNSLKQHYEEKKRGKIRHLKICCRTMALRKPQNWETTSLLVPKGRVKRHEVKGRSVVVCGL